MAKLYKLNRIVSTKSEAVSLSQTGEGLNKVYFTHDGAVVTSGRVIAEKNVMEGVQYNGEDLTIDSNKKVNVVVNGGTVKLDGYSKAETTSAIGTGDTVNAAIGKLEKAIEDTGGDAITEIEAGNGIAVTPKANHKQTVSAKIKSGDDYIELTADGIASKGIDDAIKSAIEALDVTDTAATGQYVSQVSETDGKITVTRADIPVLGVKNGEKVVSLDADRNIQTTLTIAYNSESYKIQLKGINNEVVSEFDASAFIKDGMLYGQAVFTASAATQEVTIKLQKHVFSGLTSGNTYLAMCFSNEEATGTTYTWDRIDVTSLIDVYTAGNGLQLANGQFSVKLDTANEGFLTVSENGLKLSGVQNAINTEKTRAMGAEGVLTALTTDAKDNLVASINEVDANADANATAISEEITRAESAESDLDTKIDGIKTTIDNYTVNTKKISTNPVLNGADIKLDGYTKAAAIAGISAADTVNVALGKIEAILDYFTWDGEE